ncbi:hypothetical protein CPC08DRAFT_723791 [Agrocybe pediades]|nr:hypothetical protein CPC08DRAFT_723791 [Agrocybe pediades]
MSSLTPGMADASGRGSRSERRMVNTVVDVVEVGRRWRCCPSVEVAVVMVLDIAGPGPAARDNEDVEEEFLVELVVAASIKGLLYGASLGSHDSLDIDSEEVHGLCYGVTSTVTVVVDDDYHDRRTEGLWSWTEAVYSIRLLALVGKSQSSHCNFVDGKVHYMLSRDG